MYFRYHITPLLKNLFNTHKKNVNFIMSDVCGQFPIDTLLKIWCLLQSFGKRYGKCTLNDIRISLNFFVIDYL